MSKDVVVIEEVKKPAVNLLDALLGSDIGKIDMPKKTVEIKRLSEVFGTAFKVTLQAISASKWEELQDMAVNVSGKDVEVDTSLLQTFVLIECVMDEAGNPLFKNMELVEHFGCITPKDLVKKLLLSGEIINLYGQITELSGFGDNSIDEIKN